MEESTDDPTGFEEGDYRCLFGVVLCVGCTKRNAYHEKVVTLAAELGTRQRSKEDVRALMHEPCFRGLTLHEDSSTEWSIEAPTEFGAKNWVLYTEFRDSRVAALRVRTVDSKNEHPNSVSADKVFLPL